jgi:single-strand DNA-binding protein
MLSINKVMITGRLTRDPETRYLQSGTAVTTIGMAVNRRFQDKNGEWRDETMFIDVEAWGKLAERCAESMKKGQPVFVEGRLKQDTWERDGQKRSVIRISADTVKSFDVPQRGGGQSSELSGGDEESGSYESSSGGSNTGGGTSSRPSGAPSDALNFSGGGSVKDDIPF